MLADLRFAVRRLRQSPGFALTAIVTLALGIGANTAIFSVMNAVLLRTLPVRAPQQLFYLPHQNEPPNVNTTGDTRYSYGINVYERMRQDRSVFSDLIAYVPLSLRKTAVRFGDTPEEVEADEVSGDFFSALGVSMAAGHAFVPADEEKHSPVAVLSYGYWTRRFQRDPKVIGQAVYVNGAPMTVIGVAAPHFYGVESGGNATDLWVPLQNRPGLNAWGIPASAHTLYGSPNWWNLMLIARLRPGVTQKQALARMNPVFTHAAWETVGKEVQRTGQPLELEMVPARGLGTSAEDYREPLQVLMGMVALVLLIACVNLLMLMAARNASREREFSMRLALGASRWPLFRQLLAESLLLAGLGAALGWAFAVSATGLLARWSEIEVSLAPDGTVLFFTLALAAGSALLFGLAPLRAASNAPVTLALRSGATRTSESRSRALTGKLLIAAQMALCVALLFAAGLLIRTLWNYRNVDLGMDADRVLAFGAHPVGARDKAQMLAFYTQLTDRVRALPGVRAATVAELRPGSGWTDGGVLIMDGRHYSYDNGRGLLYTNIVGPDFFRTLGIPVLAGRGLSESDTAGALPVAVVNQTFAERFLNGASPIGHMLGEGKSRATIVGVVRDNKYQSAGEEPRAMAWYCFLQDPILGRMDVEVRAVGDPRALLPEVQRIVRELDPNAPVEDPMVLKAQFEESYLTPTLFARLGAFFGALAALLVAVGLYGTLAYRVNRRVTEIGLRMALGAARGQVLWMILRDSLAMVAAGLAVGLPLAWIGSQLMAAMLYQLSPHDPVSLAAAALGVVVVSLAAALVPARRAASVEPMQALRAE
jgi:predicted permease